VTLQPISNDEKSIRTNTLPYHHEVMLAAKLTTLEPALIHAIITVESKHNALATSKKGAYGLMQLMPETASRFKVNNINDPQQNILAGAKYMQELLIKFNGDLNLSLAAYNAGPAAVQKYGGKIPPYNETLIYVPKVLKYYHQYS
jgi:soluble lytic murein transglycosylase-like protein